MSQLKKVQFKDIREFVTKFNSYIEYDIPLSYFWGQDVWSLVEKGSIIGGFAFVNNCMPRSILQIPNQEWCLNEDTGVVAFPNIQKSFHLEDIAEVTGYWMSKNKGSFKLTCLFVLRALLHPAKYFVYSYPVSHKGLANYYSKGKPLLLYRGKPNSLEGHKESMEPESVELITSFGLFRIFAHRVLKILKNRIRRL